MIAEWLVGLWRDPASMASAGAPTATVAPTPTAGGSSGTFLTGMDLKGKLEIADPPGMENVHKQYGDLNGMVGVLSEKVSGVLQKQERDFLAAYRAHNYNVQKELQDLRNKVQEAENSLQKNDKVHKLEEERSWYRKEALRLDAFTTSMKADLKAMREKLEAIEDDRNWLERQLKASKKQNKLLRAELEIRLDGGGGGSGVNDMGGGDMGGSRSGAGGPLASFSASMVGGEGVAGGVPREREITGERELRYQREEARLRKELASERRTTARLRSLVVERQNGKAELEEFFLRSIEAVKKSIVRRRRAAANANGGSPAKGGASAVEGGRMSSSVRAQDPVLGVGPGLGGPEEEEGRAWGEDGDFSGGADAGGDAAIRQALGGLSGFTATDRARVIESLLGQDEVLAFLYDHLFPPPGEEGTGTKGGGGGGGAMPMPLSPVGAAAGSGAKAVQAMASGGGGPLGIDADTQAYLTGGGGR